jgi:hypothetical protein
MLRWFFFWRPPVMLRTCIINLRDDPTTAINGVLWSTRGPWLTFRNASLLKAGQPPTPMDGDVLIHSDRVLFLQVP